VGRVNREKKGDHDLSISIAPADQSGGVGIGNDRVRSKERGEKKSSCHLGLGGGVRGKANLDRGGGQKTVANGGHEGGVA